MSVQKNLMSLFFFLMIRRPPRSTPFPTRRSSDLLPVLEHQQQAPSSTGPRVGGRTRGGRAGPGRVQPVRGHALECAEYGHSGGLPFHPERMPSFEHIHPLRGRLPGGSFPRHPRIHSSHAASGAPRDAVGDRPTCRVRCMPTTGTKTAIVNMWARWSEAPKIRLGGKPPSLLVGFTLTPLREEGSW